MVELVTTALLSQNMYALVSSVAVLAATKSDSYVAVSIVSCLFKNQSVGVVLTECNIAVTDFPGNMSWSRLASKNVVVITLFHNGLG